MTETRTTCPTAGWAAAWSPAWKVNGQRSGDETHPANLGRLCVKGSALGKQRVTGALLRPLLTA
jgi:assimilatory nitrate reductase catalytic subunit